MAYKPFALSEVSPTAGVAKQAVETQQPFALSLSKGVSWQCLRPSFDRPVLSEVEGLSPNGQSFAGAID
jgi:hypothetical protein